MIGRYGGIQVIQIPNYGGNDKILISEDKTKMYIPMSKKLSNRIVNTKRRKRRFDKRRKQELVATLGRIGIPFIKGVN